MGYGAEFSVKGGAGSGNFGHSGRPGKVGGSAPKRGGASAGVDIPAIPAEYDTPTARRIAESIMKSRTLAIAEEEQDRLLSENAAAWATLDTRLQEIKLLRGTGNTALLNQKIDEYNALVVKNNETDSKRATIGNAAIDEMGKILDTGGTPAPVFIVAGKGLLRKMDEVSETFDLVKNAFTNTDMFSERLPDRAYQPDTIVVEGSASVPTSQYNEFVSVRTNEVVERKIVIKNIKGVSLDKATFIHETGHFLDRYTKIGRKVAEFYKKRRGNEPLSIIKTPFSSFEGVKDNYIDGYMGKFYPNKRVPEGFTTEILSRGLEMLFSNPRRLLTKDPEYFGFMIDLLKGK